MSGGGKARKTKENMCQRTDSGVNNAVPRRQGLLNANLRATQDKL